MVKRLWFQYVRNLPYYATDSVRTWRDTTARLSEYGLPLEHLRILEVGCGYAYPYVLLFDGAGACPVGIDVVPLTRRDIDLRRYSSMRRREGLFSVARRVGRDLAFNLSFDRQLVRASSLKLSPQRAQLARMDGARMAFEDASFDFVYSSACFEHLEDVSAVTSEIARVLRPGGIAEVEVHLFTSMTGGHETELYFHQPPPATFPLWRHLLDQNWSAPVFLNRWRAHQYTEAFAKWFDLREQRVTSDFGSQYLTPSLLAQLTPTYSVEELSAETLLFVLSPKSETF